VGGRWGGSGGDGGRCPSFLERWWCGLAESCNTRVWRDSRCEEVAGGICASNVLTRYSIVELRGFYRQKGNSQATNHGSHDPPFTL
jgi:hypothetical protein